MGFMLICSRKRPLTYNIMSENPNKKRKLEFKNQTDANVGNDDLWGQDDAITAEEFDMLEIQATQSCNQNCSALNNTLQTSSFPQKASNSAELHNLKQLQYELEGRVKLLSFSLEKSSKELNEERSNREQIINQRMKQFHEQESHLKKEIEKMKSILEFKEQEMKSTYSKLQILKSQFQDKKAASASTSVNSNFDDLLKSNSKYNQPSFRHNSFSSVKHFRKYRLPLDVPKGEVNGAEILSFFLCSRLFISPSSVNKEQAINYGSPVDSSSSFTLAPLSVLHFKNEQKCDDIVEYYSNFLTNHVNMLKALACRNNQATVNNSLPVLIKTKEAYSSQTVISYLSDIAYLYSSPSLKSFHQKCDRNYENSHKNMHLEKNERKSFSSIQKDEKLTVSNSTLMLLQSLSALSNPKTYPNGYHKNEEMEFAVSALLSVYSSCPKHCLDLTEDIIPCYFFTNPHQSITGLCTSLKLLTAVCSKKGFTSYLVHKDNNCVFCLIADFLHVVPADPEKFALAVILVEDFLSTVFSIHSYKETKLEASSCISKVIQGLIKSTWKYFQIRDQDALCFEILKKGFLLLHFISSCIPSFKEKRSPVEDEYISLISGILAVSKEKSELRQFYDLIHNLWDFQTDISEFDLDELAEEAYVCTNNSETE